MNRGLNYLLILLAASLTACSSGTDNSELPAPLTRIENALPLALNWKVATSTAINAASYRLRPFQNNNRIFSIDIRGLIYCVDATLGNTLWKHDTGFKAIAGIGGNDEWLLVTSRDGDIAAFRHSADGLEPGWNIRVDSELRSVPVLDGERVVGIEAAGQRW